MNFFFQLLNAFYKGTVDKIAPR